METAPKLPIFAHPAAQCHPPRFLSTHRARRSHSSGHSGRDWRKVAETERVEVQTPQSFVLLLSHCASGTVKIPISAPTSTTRPWRDSRQSQQQHLQLQPATFTIGDDCRSHVDVVGVCQHPAVAGFHQAIGRSNFQLLHALTPISPIHGTIHVSQYACARAIRLSSRARNRLWAMVERATSPSCPTSPDGGHADSEIRGETICSADGAGSIGGGHQNGIQSNLVCCGHLKISEQKVGWRCHCRSGSRRSSPEIHLPGGRRAGPFPPAVAPNV